MRAFVDIGILHEKASNEFSSFANRHGHRWESIPEARDTEHDIYCKLFEVTIAARRSLSIHLDRHLSSSRANRSRIDRPNQSKLSSCRVSLLLILIFRISDVDSTCVRCVRLTLVLFALNLTVDSMMVSVHTQCARCR